MLMRGVNAAVAYQIVSEDGKTTRTGYLTDGETVQEADLFHGTYAVTVTLPEGTLLTGVNGLAEPAEGSGAVAGEHSGDADQPL